MSTSLKHKLLTVYRFIYRVIDLYAKTALIAVIAIVSAQVVARNVFKSNIRWNQEVALLLTIWMAFLGISIGVDKGLHIQVELFYSLFPKALQRVIDRLNQVLLLINVILLVLGCFMDLTPLVLIMTPILLPVVKSFGMDPVQFGVMMMLNLGIGLCTPPVGTALFTGCAISGQKIETVSKATLPLYIPMIIVLLMVTYIPALTMLLPNLLMN